MRLVLALGGNALARRGEPIEAARQQRRVAEAAERLAPLARAHEVVVTHGNGPQLGWLALQQETQPLDALDAETEGLIGYWIERELASQLPERDVATLLTRVAVDPEDPAFARPTKPVGAVYAADAARTLARERGYEMAPDGAAGWRRVVASPDPQEVLGLRAVEALLEAGIVVVCGGGGGIPVVREADGRQRGVEAVIDKDLASALLASRLGADALLLLTDVDGVHAHWPDPGGRPLGSASCRDLRARRFDAGSMAPKVEAACRFVEAGGAFAAIGALDDAAEVLSGARGTRVLAKSERERP